MRYKGVYAGMIFDELRRRGLGWGIRKTAKYLLLRAMVRGTRAWFGPFVVEFSLTYRCPCNCFMCGLSKRHDAGKEPLNLGDFRELAAELKHVGTEAISLGGGEPLLFEGLEDLVSSISELGLVVKLNTSGYPLDERKAEDLVRAGISAVAVSLDGATSASHDALRGRPGSFEGARKAVELFHRARSRLNRNLRISTVTVLSSRNIDQAVPIYDLTAGWPSDHTAFMPVQNSQGVELEPLSRQQLRTAIDAVKRRAGKDRRLDPSWAYLRQIAGDSSGRSRRVLCAAGLLTCVVDCYGDVYPCEAWYTEGRRIGNIRKTRFRRLWYGDDYRKVRRELLKCSACSWECQLELNNFFL